jgi:uncharacterized protein (TIGR02145 family)
VNRDEVRASQPFIDKELVEAKGLTIYNTTKNCVEYWNGSEWIGAGCPPVPPNPAITNTQGACSNGKVADLLPSGLDWYTAATGGAALAPTTVLSTLGASPLTLYASQTISGVESTSRTEVTITLANCSSAPAGAITTFVKVMYDFQHQTLEAYKTGTADAVGFKWQVSRTINDADFKDIPGAPNSKYYTIPAGFYDASSTTTLLAGQTEDADKSLYFRCVLTNPLGTVPTPNTFNIFFINTSTYATDAQGRKYVTLGKGSGGDATGQSGTMKMLLLSLGQSGDSYTPGSSDAADLGDFYQWGRVADGHQKTVWSKNASHTNQILPMDGAGTSAVVARAAANYDSNGQVLNTETSFYGKFITYGSGDWNTNETNDRWGIGSGYSTRASDISLSGWVHPSNNPCPGTEGWKVPSRWNSWDLYKGTGTDVPVSSSNYEGSDNTWHSFIDATNGAIGGTVITSNASEHQSERVFLPAAGYRSYGNGKLFSIGAHGLYWSSTYYNTTDASSLSFTSSDVSDVSAGNSSYGKAGGFSVRCVAE